MTISNHVRQFAQASEWSGGRTPFAGVPALDLAGLSRSTGAAASPAPSPLLRQVLDALGFGLVLVDSEARVLHANPAASLLCRAGAPLALRERRLCAGDDDLLRLTLAVRAAATGQWAMLVLGDEQVQLSVGVVPLGGTGAGCDDSDAVDCRLAAMLVIGGERRSNRLALHFFARAHQLTAAESAVLEALSEGHSPSQIARQGGVAISTVRTQIATVRAKVNARSICHLMHMVATLPPLMGASVVGGA